jgi:hypothetical protein
MNVRISFGRDGEGWDGRRYCEPIKGETVMVNMLVKLPRDWELCSIAPAHPQIGVLSTGNPSQPASCRKPPIPGQWKDDAA